MIHLREIRARGIPRAYHQYVYVYIRTRKVNVCEHVKTQHTRRYLVQSVSRCKEMCRIPFALSKDIAALRLLVCDKSLESQKKKKENAVARLLMDKSMSRYRTNESGIPGDA